MMTMRKKQRFWLIVKITAVLCLGVLVFTPKDIDLSALALFNPLVTQVQAAAL